MKGETIPAWIYFVPQEIGVSVSGGFVEAGHLHFLWNFMTFQSLMKTLQSW